MKKSRNNLTVTPDGLSGVSSSQLTRSHPVLDRTSRQTREEIERFAAGYSRFLDQVRISSDVVKYVVDSVRGSKIHAYTDQDKQAYVLIRPGTRPITDGFRLIYAHNDSPCLRLKANAIDLEWDPDLQPLHLGVELATIAFGGINNHQWTGRSVNVMGYAVINGGRRNVNLAGYIPEVCVHTDTRSSQKISFEDAHTQEALKIDTGCRNIQELLGKLGLRDREDFARARLFAVPNTKATRLGPYIASYGHDDRVGVYSSLIALLNSPQPKHTSIVCGFDNEEVGSTGHAGASGHFFDEVLNRWLLKTRTVRSLADLTEALKLNIFSKSFAIDADAEVGATAREEDKSRIDIRNVPKLGFGPFVNCSDGTMEGDQTSPTLIDRIMRILGDKQVPFQPTGTVMVADMAHNTATMNCFFERRGLPVINVGPPVGSLHSPEEIAHVGDIYRAYQAYMAILEDSKGQKERSVSLTTSSNTR